jgi:hypothetical protein
MPDLVRGLPPWLHVPPYTVAMPSLRSQLKGPMVCMYKAPMHYPHLSPCTSGGMSMTIAPPKGLTQKHRLGLQVSYSVTKASSGRVVEGRCEQVLA